jgi:hypothetical protein
MSIYLTSFISAARRRTAGWGACWAIHASVLPWYCPECDARAARRLLLLFRSAHDPTHGCHPFRAEAEDLPHFLRSRDWVADDVRTHVPIVRSIWDSRSSRTSPRVTRLLVRCGSGRRTAGLGFSLDTTADLSPSTALPARSSSAPRSASRQRRLPESGHQAINLPVR